MTENLVRREAPTAGPAPLAAASGQAGPMVPAGALHSEAAAGAGDPGVALAAQTGVDLRAGGGGQCLPGGEHGIPPRPAAKVPPGTDQQVLGEDIVRLYVLADQLKRDPDETKSNTGQLFLPNSGPPLVPLAAMVPVADPQEEKVAPASGEDVFLITGGEHRHLNAGTTGFWDRDHKQLVVRRTWSLEGPSRLPDAAIKETMIHESQHAMMHVDDLETPSGVDAGAWASFETEHAAYWASGKFETLDGEHSKSQHNPQINHGKPIAMSERSFAILAYILETGAYPAICDAYRKSKKFREMVHHHNGPHSTNAKNDPFVERFIRALTSSGAQDLVGAIDRLPHPSRESMRQNAEFDAILQRHLPEGDAGVASMRVMVLGGVYSAFSAVEAGECFDFLAAFDEPGDQRLRDQAIRLSGRVRQFLVYNSVGLAALVNFHHTRAVQIRAKWPLRRLELLIINGVEP